MGPALPVRARPRLPPQTRARVERLPQRIRLDAVAGPENRLRRMRYRIVRTGADIAMARETFFVVQSFIAGRGKALKADPAVPCKSADAARRMAERLSVTKLGVVAFSTSGDAEPGDFD